MRVRFLYFYCEFSFYFCYVYLKFSIIYPTESSLSALQNGKTNIKKLREHFFNIVFFVFYYQILLFCDLTFDFFVVVQIIFY